MTMSCLFIQIEKSKNNRDKKCTLIDVAIPSEKLSKYKDLEKEITRMWQMKTEIIPVVVGALGMIKKGSQKLIKEISGKISPWEIQKTALLGTTYILRKVLSKFRKSSFYQNKKERGMNMKWKFLFSLMSGWLKQSNPLPFCSASLAPFDACFARSSSTVIS